MRIAVTGGSGYLGTAVVRELVAAGHRVVAPVRSGEAAGAVGGLGAEPVVGDLFDDGWLAGVFAGADAVAHLAATGGATPEQLDRGVLAAVTRAGKPYVHTSGVWLWGSNPAITEVSPVQPPELTAWRIPVEEAVLTSGLVVTILAPGIVHGRGGGIPAELAATRTPDGRVPLIGGGTQHWTTVHVDDVAALYRIVLERGEGLGYLLGVSGHNPTVRELGEAVAGGPDGVVAETPEQSRERLGRRRAEALMLDQQATGAKARSLGWTPTRPPLVDELRATAR